MSCKLIHKHPLQVTDATLVQGTSATIVVAPEVLLNADIYVLRYCVKFQDATGAEELLIDDDGTVIPILDKFGNPVTLGRLCRRELLYLRYSSIDPAHFTLLNCLKCQTIRTVEVEAAAAGE